MMNAKCRMMNKKNKNQMVLTFILHHLHCIRSAVQVSSF